jgi:beta-phosphoglucomutase
MPPKAILFDFDGVIADTENHHIAAWQRTLAVMGWQVADEVAARSAEIDDRDFLTQLFAHVGMCVVYL